MGWDEVVDWLALLEITLERLLVHDSNDNNDDTNGK